MTGAKHHSTSEWSKKAQFYQLLQFILESASNSFKCRYCTGLADSLSSCSTPNRMRVLCPIRRPGRRCRSPRPHHRRKIVYCCGRSFVRTYKMSKSLQPFSSADSLAKLKKLFGPPPVLGSEDPRAYDGMLAQFLADIKPRDFIAEMWVRYATDAFWEALRYERHKKLSVEGQYRERNGRHGAGEGGAD